MTHQEVLRSAEPARKKTPAVDTTLLQQAAERCRDAASGTPLLEALRHLQACFGWETVLTLLARLDSAEGELWDIRELLESAGCTEPDAGCSDRTLCMVEELRQRGVCTESHILIGSAQPPWRPTVGDWVRVIESGHVARVHSTEPNGYGELGGVRLEPGELQKRRRQPWFDARLLEKWVPRPTERVCHHATKAEGAVLRIDGGKAWIIEWATYCGLAFLQPVVI